MTEKQDSPLPSDFYLLEDDNSAAHNRPNRLCICLSDVHFTDNTVGNQSAEAVVWNKVFGNITDMCIDKKIEELTIVLVGDVVDMIRTAQWSKNNVYPWQREHPRFKEILREIMQGIIEQHATPPTGQKCGFFHLLQQLPKQLAGKGKKHHCTVKTLVLLGNHDKEIFADDVTLKMFYEQCLGQPVTTLSVEYRRWIGKMYFNDENHYADKESVPRLPFYWGDIGFRLFVTHGQWRDEENSRRIEPQQDKVGWQVKDGWRPDVWQALDYAPFTQACFGDTVAAGALSGFIYRTKTRLETLEAPLIAKQTLSPKEVEEKTEIDRLKQILDELDLYRPTYAAVQRIIKEIWRLRKKDHSMKSIENIIEEELMGSIYTWLNWDFTLESSPLSRRVILQLARPVVSVLKVLGVTVELGFIYGVMWLLNKLQQGIFYHKDDPSYREMRRFPAFLEAYRNYGFRIHGEGHTHISLQEELNFDKPEENPNYTYINFGTWRDQIVPKQKKKYRRRGVGRALSIIDLAPVGEKQERGFAYWVEDVLHWSSQLDAL